MKTKLLIFKVLFVLIFSAELSAEIQDRETEQPTFHQLLWNPAYIPDENGDVDTADWMGWLNASLDPWIWSYSLESWIWIEWVGGPPPDFTGAWVYVLKSENLD